MRRCNALNAIVSVCLSVCVSARISQIPCPNFTKFSVRSCDIVVISSRLLSHLLMSSCLYKLPMAVGRSSDNSAMRYTPGFVYSPLHYGSTSVTRLVVIESRDCVFITPYQRPLIGHVSIIVAVVWSLRNMILLHAVTARSSAIAERSCDALCQFHTCTKNCI